MTINLAGVLAFHAARRPSKTAITDGEVVRTYAQLLERTTELAAALQELGIGRGDVVALLLYNRVEFIEALHAVSRLGAVFLPLNYRLAPAEWQFILSNSRARAIITEDEFASDVERISDVLPRMDTFITTGDRRTAGWERYEDLVASAAGRSVAIADTRSAHLQRIMYTSGTTSRPKGVRITHANVAWKNAALATEFSWTASEVTMVVGPLYHVGALDMGGLATLSVGGSLVIQRKFDAEELIRNVEIHRPTSVWLAPAMVNALLQSPSLATADLSSLRLILSGGEKMPVARLRQLLDLMPSVWFADAYGLTETVSSDTFLDREHMLDKIGSVGRPVLYQELKVVNGQGVVVQPGELGEILVRGPKVFGGYLDDPEATERSFVDGWFRTGDIGRLDEDGYLYIEDRKKDMIVSGGENIATPEIERVLYEHPDIVEAAVIGRPDERWGEVPHAFVVLRPGVTLRVEEIIEFCRERLAKFKVPRTLDVLSELPRTPSGKVLKKDLRAHQTEPSHA